MTKANHIEELFRSNYANLLNQAVRLVHDPETARDIVHDVFADLLDNCPDQVTPAFLATRVRYGCLNYFRSLSVRERFAELYPIELENDDADDPEIAHRIQQIISTLGQTCRQVVKLRFGRQLKYAEIAQQLQISEAAVYKHLRHATIVLRQNLHL